MRSRSGSQVRRKPRKKSQVETEKLVMVQQKDTVMVRNMKQVYDKWCFQNKSLQSSLYETGPEDSALIQSLSSQITGTLSNGAQS